MKKMQCCQSASIWPQSVNKCTIARECKWNLTLLLRTIGMHLRRTFCVNNNNVSSASSCTDFQNWLLQCSAWKGVIRESQLVLSALFFFAEAPWHGYRIPWAFACQLHRVQSQSIMCHWRCWVDVLLLGICKNLFNTVTAYNDRTNSFNELFFMLW